jgi:hypothetical protein
MKRTFRFVFWQDMALNLFQKLSKMFLPAKGRNLTTRFTLKMSKL